MNVNARHKIDVTNVMTGESVQRLQWSRDRRSITVYTNFGVWGVFTGADAQMINNAFIAAMNQMTQMTGYQTAQTTCAGAEDVDEVRSGDS